MVQPKAILFDIGGVCVISPFQAIVDYETQNGIPKDYINFAISRTAPNGAWHKLERGEVKLDDEFFAGFRSDLHRQDLWEQYHTSFKNQRKSLAELAKSNATQLGDPVSLKAETSSTNPTPDEAGAKSSASLATSARSTGRTSLAESYQKNMLGDPTSLKNEGSSSEPLPDQADTGYSKDGSAPADSGSTSSGASSGSSSSSSTASKIPPLPTIDTTTLFWDMMARSRDPDPHMFPALQNLRKSGKFVVGALSNTVIFPPDHPYSKVAADDPNDVRKHFEVFVSSAEIGLRKPDPEIYKRAIEMLDKYHRQKGGDGIKAADVCFLDDIGENLKSAKRVGMQTIKVNLGRTDEAVKELEQVTGLTLAGSKAKL